MERSAGRAHEVFFLLWSEELANMEHQEKWPVLGNQNTPFLVLYLPRRWSLHFPRVLQKTALVRVLVRKGNVRMFRAGDGAPLYCDFGWIIYMLGTSSNLGYHLWYCQRALILWNFLASIFFFHATNNRMHLLFLKPFSPCDGKWFEH